MRRRALVDRAAGNAFYLEELIRSVAEGKGDRLPETVVAMAQARIESLELASRASVLRAASIFGQVFWRGGRRGAARRHVDAVSDWLEQLVERELVTVAPRVSRFGDEREYRFRHALVREAAYAMLTDRDRMRGHRLAGEWLESRFHADGNLDRGAAIDAVVLAEHFERGDDPQRASGWYQRAAEQALEGDDLATAIDCAERAVKALLGDVVEREPTIANDSASCGSCNRARTFGAASTQLAATRGREALAALRPASTRWLNAFATVTDACCRQLLHGEVVELCRALVDIPVTPARPRRVRPRDRDDDADGALAHARTDRHRGCSHVVDEIEAGLDPSDPVALAWVCCSKSWRALRDGDLGQCHALDSKIVDCFTLVGDLRHACQQRAYVGYDELILGAYARAEHSLRESIVIAERLGLHQVTAHAQHNLGLVLAHLGKSRRSVARSRRLAIWRARRARPPPARADGAQLPRA